MFKAELYSSIQDEEMEASTAFGYRIWVLIFIGFSQGAFALEIDNCVTLTAAEARSF